MTEALCIEIPINPTITFVNSEAYTARQLLNRHLSDAEADDENDDDEEEDIEDIEQEEDEEDSEEKGEEVEDIKDENGDDTLIPKSNNEHISHSKSPLIFSSVLSLTSPVDFGRGSRRISMVIPLNYFFKKNHLDFRFLLVQYLLLLKLVLYLLLININLHFYYLNKSIKAIHVYYQ